MIMPYTCYVPGCYDRSSKDSGISFYRFPEDPTQRRRWIQAIGRKSNDSNSLFKPDSRSHRVCSAHFVGGSKSKEQPIPSVFPLKQQKPTTNARKSNTSTRAARPISPIQPTAAQQQENNNQKLIASGQAVPYVGAHVVVGASKPEIMHRDPYSVTGDHIYASSAVLPQTPTKRKAATDLFSTMKKVSVSRAEIKSLSRKVLTFETIKNSSDTLNLNTGFKDVKHMQALIDFLRPDFPHIRYPTSRSFSDNILTPETCLLLTLTKYKLDSPQNDLAFRFGITQGDVSRIVTAWSDLMYRRFREVNIWPSQNQVKQTMPDSFKEKYSKTRVIIDCTEIFIQRPSASTVQQLTYSTYKSHNTAKALIGIAPNCFITFLPDIQPGRLSDKEIVIRSGLPNLLESGDLLMADRGFTIEDLQDHTVELNIPPFLANKSQFDSKEVAYTRSIAAVRIHVERVIGRVRRYNILNNSFPNNSLALLNKIWVNCCYLTNLQHPSF